MSSKNTEELFKKELPIIPDKIKAAVFGYIRQQQSSVLEGKLIAPLIPHLCLFYYHIKEFWTAHDEEIHVVTKEKDVMINIVETHEEDEYTFIRGTVYGNVKTDVSFLGIYRWTLKILGGPTEEQLYIGIDASNKKYLRDDYSDPLDSEGGFDHYAFGDGNKYSAHTSETQYGDISRVGFCEGDVIQMELNTLQKSIKLIINDEDQGIAFDDVDTSQSYHMAVTTYTFNAAVKIVNYEQICLQEN